MILNLFTKHYNNYMLRFYNDFDLIKNTRFSTFSNVQFANSASPPSPKLHYLFGMLTIFYLGIETVIIFVQKGIFKNKNYESITHIESIFSHRIFPKMFWHQGDIIALVGLSMAVIVLIVLWRRVPPSNQCTFFALTDSKTEIVVKLVNVKGEGMLVEFKLFEIKQMLFYSITSTFGKTTSFSSHFSIRIELPGEHHSRFFSALFWAANLLAVFVHTKRPFLLLYLHASHVVLRGFRYKTNTNQLIFFLLNCLKLHSR